MIALSSSPETEAHSRFVALIATGQAKYNDESIRRARRETFTQGIGINYREAYMHASIRPRYTNPTAIQRVRRPEQLSLLGRLLYG